MTRRHVGLLASTLAFLLHLSAQGQDLVLDPGSGSFIVSARPALTKISPDQLRTDLPTPAYLALYNLSGQTSVRCELLSGWKVQISHDAQSLTVEVQAPYLLVTRYSGTSFDSVPGEPGYFAYKLVGYNPILSFKVTDAQGQPQCANAAMPTSNLGTDLTGHYLAISNDAAMSPKGDNVDSDDPPIPIIGSSLRLRAPKGLEFHCHGNRPATLPGIEKIFSLNIGHYKLPYERLVDLQGIRNWRIIAYPQQLEISRGPGKTLQFSIPSSGRLTCDRDNDGSYLQVADQLGAATRPQEFTVDWSRGAFTLRRSVSVPCGSCRLGLAFKRIPTSQH